MKTKQPWLSVIIPVYNAEKYLKRCIESIRFQSFENYEVLLIDDGSTDDSSAICQKVCSSDPRFHYYGIENGGPFRARLFGARHVTAEYFTFCDADDYYLNHKVFEFLFIKISKLPEKASVFQFGYLKKYNHLLSASENVKRYLHINSKDFITREYPKLLCSFWDESHLSMNVWNKLYSSSLRENLPEHGEKVFWGDDLILNLYLLEAIEGAYYIPKALYVYRQSSGGTNRFSLHTMEDLDVIKRYQLAFLDKRDMDDSDKLRQILYSEVAGWFLAYIREAGDHLAEEDIRGLIIKSLQLPSFIQARNYYKEHESDNRAECLLGEADIEKYMEEISVKKREPIKIRIIRILKKFYMRI